MFTMARRERTIPAQFGGSANLSRATKRDCGNSRPLTQEILKTAFEVDPVQIHIVEIPIDI